MNNFDRNTRTLIVSFLIAIFALIPLRFVEAGTEQLRFDDAQVLGESVNVVNEMKTVEEVSPKLEAPYDELENCRTESEVMLIEDQITQLLEENTLSDSEMVDVLNELKRVETNICK
ncbi:MAG: hypothetical protein WC503_04925 [Candidatus Shapirobacteria bacterium]